MQAFLEAAEGIRTHDLLHGKQNVYSRFAREKPCKPPGSLTVGADSDSPAFTGKPRDLGTQRAPELPSRSTRSQVTQDAPQVQFRVPGLEAVFHAAPICLWASRLPTPSPNRSESRRKSSMGASAIALTRLLDHGPPGGREAGDPTSEG